MSNSAILTVTLLAATAAMSGLPSVGHENAPPNGRAGEPPAGDRIRVEHDADAFVTTIKIRAEDGRVAWSDVLRALARARGNDDEALEGIGREGSFPVSGPTWLALSVGINLALQPNVSFGVEPPEDQGGQPWLVIELDREALLASKRRFTARLRSVWMLRRPSQKDYGLVLDDAWQKAPADRNLVVVVHGLDSSPEKVEPLFRAIRDQGLPCAAFRYPNDQPIAASAKLLAAELAQFAQDHPGRGVSLVTSSMGGLVARAVIEDPRLDPGNVRQLVMVAPPNHGSALARFGFALDVWEHVAGAAGRKEVRVFYGMVEDGLSEAAADLRPGSPFLEQLNARDRNPKVRYTIFLGTDGPLSPAELALMRKSIAEAGQRSRWVRFFGARAHTWLEDLDEVVQRKGDGAVSVQRGRLAGVEDTVLLKFRHVRLLPAGGRDDTGRLYTEVLKRLKAPEG